MQQNKALTPSEILEMTKISKVPLDAHYAYYISKTNELEYGKLSLDTSNYPLIEGLSCFKTAEDYVLGRTPFYSKIFLGKSSSYVLLEDVSRVYTPRKFIGMMKRYTKKRTEETRKLEDGKIRATLLRNALTKARSCVDMYAEQTPATYKRL